MPSLLSTDVTANYLKNVRANGLGPRTLIVSISKTNITDTELNTIINYMTSSQGSNGSGDSAFVVAGTGTADGSAFVSGTTDVVYVALQGTGTYTVDASDAHGVTGAATAIVAVFQDNYQAV
jgi:hypothetical protein